MRQLTIATVVLLVLVAALASVQARPSSAEKNTPGNMALLVAGGRALTAGFGEQQSSKHDDDHGVHCNESAIRGTYQLVTNGANVAAGRLSAAVGIFTADGSGNLSGNITTSDNGVIFRAPFSGTYTVNADCTGSVEIPGGSFTQADFVIDPKGEALHLIVTNTGAVITGFAQKIGK